MTDVIEDSFLKSERYFEHSGFADERLRPFSCNGERLPIPDNSVDVLFLMEAIEHFERPHAGFQEFYRVLKSGGICLVTTPRPSQSFVFVRLHLLGRLLPYRGFPKHLMVDFSICDENFFKIIHQNGFKEIRRRFLNVTFPLIQEPLLKLLHFSGVARLYAAFNMRILSRLFPLFRRAQFRVLKK